MRPSSNTTGFVLNATALLAAAYNWPIATSHESQAVVNPLYQILAGRVKEWRDAGYPSENYPALAEILEYQVEAETGAPRFLRLPQLRALETYWYLRLVAGTPRVFDLYRTLYPRPRDLREALGLTGDSIRD